VLITITGNSEDVLSFEKDAIIYITNCKAEHLKEQRKIQGVGGGSGVVVAYYNGKQVSR
jgi:hypothetical protein